MRSLIQGVAHQVFLQHDTILNTSPHLPPSFPTQDQQSAAPSQTWETKTSGSWPGGASELQTARPTQRHAAIWEEKVSSPRGGGKITKTPTCFFFYSHLNFLSLSFFLPGFYGCTAAAAADSSLPWRLTAEDSIVLHLARELKLKNPKRIIEMLISSLLKRPAGEGGSRRGSQLFNTGWFILQTVERADSAVTFVMWLTQTFHAASRQRAGFHIHTSHVSLLHDL